MTRDLLQKLGWSTELIDAYLKPDAVLPTKTESLGLEASCLSVDLGFANNVEVTGSPIAAHSIRFKTRNP